MFLYAVQGISCVMIKREGRASVNATEARACKEMNYRVRKNSMRRFFWRPSAVLLSATGLSMP